MKKFVVFVTLVSVLTCLCLSFATMAAEAPVLLSYTFDGGKEEWSAGTGNSGGICAFDVPGADGSISVLYWAAEGFWMASPMNLGVNLADAATLRVTLANVGSVNVAEVSFTLTMTDGTTKVIPVAIDAATTAIEYKEYTVDLTAIDGLTGTLDELRFDCGKGADQGAQNVMYITDITIEGAVPAEDEEPEAPATGDSALTMAVVAVAAVAVVALTKKTSFSK